MIRRRALLALTAAVPLAVVTACGGEAGEAGDGGQVTLTWINPHQGAYDQAVAAFEEAHPDIRIEQQTLPFDEMISQVQARLGSQDSSIDIVSVDPPRILNMVENGFLDPVPDTARDIAAGAVVPIALESLTVGDQLYAYPVWTSDNVIIYNSTALEEAGVEAPPSDPDERWTWEELLEAAQEVVDAGGTRYGFGIEQVDRYYAIQPMAQAISGSSGLTGPDNLTPEVNTAGWVEFGEWYGDLFASGLSPRGVDASQMPEVFASGDIAFYLAGPTRFTQLQESSLADQWGIAPHPYFDGREIMTPTDSWAVGVSAHSEHQEAAHTFAEWVTLTTEGASAMSAQFNLPPVNTEAYPVFIDRLNEEIPGTLEDLDAILTRDTEEHAIRRPQSVGYVEFETLMARALSDIRNGADVQSTLDSAQNNIERQLQRYQ